MCLFHERHADALGHPAEHLTTSCLRIDDLADVENADQVLHAYREQVGVYAHLDELRAERVERVFFELRAGLGLRLALDNVFSTEAHEFAIREHSLSVG